MTQLKEDYLQVLGLYAILRRHLTDAKGHLKRQILKHEHSHTSYDEYGN